MSGSDDGTVRQVDIREPLTGSQEDHGSSGHDNINVIGTPFLMHREELAELAKEGYDHLQSPGASRSLFVFSYRSADKLLNCLQLIRGRSEQAAQRQRLG